MSSVSSVASHVSALGIRWLAPTLMMSAVVILTTAVEGAEPGSIEERRAQADALVEKTERAYTQRIIARLSGAAQIIRSELDLLRSEADALRARRESLKTSDEGKRLGASLNELSITEWERLLADPLYDVARIDLIRKQVIDIQAELAKQKQEGPPGYLPPVQVESELSKLGAEVRGSLAHVRERSKRVEEMLRDAPVLPDPAKAVNLQGALDAFRRREQTARKAVEKIGAEEGRAQGLQQVTENARIAALERMAEHSRELLADARAEIERQKLDFEARLKLLAEEQQRELADINKRLADSEAGRAVTNAKAEATRIQGQQDAEKVRLVQRCRDPQVQKLLAPFLAHGIWQPGDRKGEPQVRERGPMSYSGIQATGALQPTPDGLKSLLELGNATVKSSIHKNVDTERPHWGFSFSAKRLSESDWDQIRKAQSLLNELGPTMVELKLLSP